MEVSVYLFIYLFVRFFLLYIVISFMLLFELLKFEYEYIILFIFKIIMILKNLCIKVKCIYDKKV